MRATPFLFLLTALVFARSAGADAFIPDEPGPVPAHAVGVVVLDPDLQHFHGRTGEPGAEGAFSTAGQCYRRIYLLGLSADEGSLLLKGIKPGDVYSPVGAKMPTTAELAEKLGIQKIHTLVEADVNEGLGSGPEDRLVLTNVKRLDGSPGYPADTDLVVEEAKVGYANLPTADVDTALEKAKSAATTPPPPWAARVATPDSTAVRANKDLCYVTWMPDTKALEIRFRRIAIDARSVRIGTAEPAVFQHTQWGVQRDATFTWKAGKLTHAVSAPVLFHYEHKD